MSQRSAKNSLSLIHSSTLKEIRDAIGDTPTWAAADETTDVCGQYVANLIVGRLDVNPGSKAYLLSCRTLEKTNHTTAARFVNNSLRLLWPDVNGENLNIFYTDAAPYMAKAAEVLKVFYPNLLHVTCLARKLNRIAEEVRNSHPLVNDMISAVKKAF